MHNKVKMIKGKILSGGRQFKVTLVYPKNQVIGNSATVFLPSNRVRNVKFATYLKFATCGNTCKINELR